MRKNSVPTGCVIWPSDPAYYIEDCRILYRKSGSTNKPTNHPISFIENFKKHHSGHSGQQLLLMSQSGRHRCLACRATTLALRSRVPSDFYDGEFVERALRPSLYKRSSIYTIYVE